MIFTNFFRISVKITFVVLATEQDFNLWLFDLKACSRQSEIVEFYLVFAYLPKIFLQKVQEIKLFKLFAGAEIVINCCHLSV